MPHRKAPPDDPKVWIFVVDARNNEDLRDLDHLDAILWGSNPNARQGDVVLMYRTAPYSDIAYVFTAASDPRPTRPSDRADSNYVIELADKVPLLRPVTLADIKSTESLNDWSFARNQQGIMRRRRDVIEEGAWKSLRRLIVTRNRYAAAALDRMDHQVPAPFGEHAEEVGLRAREVQVRLSSKWRTRLRVFLSYGSEDYRRVRRLFNRLAEHGWIEPWFDRACLVASDNWEEEVEKALMSCDAVVICLSARSVRKVGFVNTEIGHALRLQDRQPEGTTCILPVKLEECHTPDRLAKWQYVELYRRNGFQNVLTGLQKRASFLEQTSRR